MIETSGLLAHERAEIADAVEAQREYSRALVRHAEYEPSCIDCGRIEAPGEEFEDSAEGFPICPWCIERRMEAENLEPESTVATLIDWYDRASGGLVLSRNDLRPAIEAAAKSEGYNGRMPWQTEAEFEGRRTWGPGAHEAIFGDLEPEADDCTTR